MTGTYQKRTNTLRRNMIRVRDVWLADGFRGLKQLSNHVIRSIREKRNYQKWIGKKGLINDRDRKEFLEQIEKFNRQPLISVLLPVYNVEEKWLRLCIESVFDQLYSNWELCIADDCSTKPHVRPVLEEYAAKDGRIKVIFRKENGHISAASNSTLESAKGEFAVLLDHDDELSEDALYWVAREISDHPEAQMIYSDEDLIDENGRRSHPKFKPDWSRDLFYSVNMITHLSAYRTKLLRDIEGFRLGFEGSQDYDLALRVVEQISEEQIRHIPRILYHWRTVRGSLAYAANQKPYAHERAREAIRSHFERSGKKAVVSETLNNLHRVRYALPKLTPKVSLFFCVDDVESAAESVDRFLRQTTYENFEIVLIVASPPKAPLSGNLRNVKIHASYAFGKAAKFNNAAAHSDGYVLCFGDLNLRPLSKDWLEELTSFTLQPEIGAVGAKLLYKNGTILHGGLIVGANTGVGSAHPNFPFHAAGNMSRNHLVGNFSAVSVSCMTVRRDVFDQAGGFDAENLPDGLFDADFCLRLGELNYRIVFTPYAQLAKIDEETQSNLEKKPTDEEKDYFVRKWSTIIANDPFYNPNLSKKDGSFSINIKPSGPERRFL